METTQYFIVKSTKQGQPDVFFRLNLNNKMERYYIATDSWRDSTFIDSYDLLKTICPNVRKITKEDLPAWLRKKTH